MTDPVPPLGDFLVWWKVYKRHKRGAADTRLKEPERLLECAAMAFALEMMRELTPAADETLKAIAAAQKEERILWGGIATDLDNERFGVFG